MDYDTTEIQELLKARGFDPGPIDGIFGPRTSAAIIAFKRSIGYRARDYVGKLTIAALRSSTPPETELTTAKLPWLIEGYKIKGWHEVYNNRALSEWLVSDDRFLGDPSKLPWCGDYVDTALRLAIPDEPRPGALGKNPYWALNWRLLGIPTKPVKGAICAIERPGGGHVGFLVGEDASRYYLLGGNQSNRVSVSPMGKDRFSSASFRWPSTYPETRIAVPRMTSNEASSINEA